MNGQTDVEAIVNRNHSQYITRTTDADRRSHNRMLLKWVILFILGCALSLLLRAIGQMGEILAAAVFMGSLSAAMFFLGRYVEFAKRK